MWGAYFCMGAYKCTVVVVDAYCCEIMSLCFCVVLRISSFGLVSLVSPDDCYEICYNLSP